MDPMDRPTLTQTRGMWSLGRYKKIGNKIGSLANMVLEFKWRHRQHYQYGIYKKSVKSDKKCLNRTQAFEK